MSVPKFEEFTQEQQEVFLLLTKKRNDNGEYVTLEQVISEYFYACQSADEAVRH